MKKSLVLAMAMALGVTASAQAANPFSDVPAGHWAYDSISKLAAAGIIEGYGDDTFRGDRLMTRYEMAQIVAKALAKGANVDRLAAEFADELDALGVRVSALEKKADNVKITGEVRYHYGYTKPNHDRKLSETGLRSRIYFNGKVNDNWNYVGRIENQQWFHNTEEPGAGNKGDEETSFNIAKLEGRLGGINVIAGRDDDVFADGYIYDGEHDAVKLSYGSKYYISGAYGKLTDLNDDEVFGGKASAKKFWNAEIGTNMDTFVNGKVGYLRTKLDTDGKATFDGKDDVGIMYAGLDFKLTDALGLNAMYLHSNRDIYDGLKSKKNGYVFGLAYKGAEAEEPGTWGLSANYYHQGRGTYLAHTIDGDTDFSTGFKGWSIGGEVTIAKNMVLSTTYYDTKALKGNLEGNAKTKVLWSEFNVSF